MKSKPDIGRKQLHFLAGALSFIAGAAPLMRPFLGGLQAALATTNDGFAREPGLNHKAHGTVGGSLHHGCC